MSDAAVTPLPKTCAVAFKEWRGVCSALESGRQSIILRQGGIAEGPGGFRPEHPAFWLYPTVVHQAKQGLRVHDPDEDRPVGDGSTVALRALAVVELVGRVEREERLSDLEEFHVWTAATVRSRFLYREPGLWVLGVRVYLGPSARPLAVTAEHAGCKSWVPLDPPLATAGLAPVLDPEVSSRTLDRIRSLLDPV